MRSTLVNMLGSSGLLIVTGALVLGGAGCDTQAFCFSDCGEGNSTTDGGNGGGDGGTTGQFVDGGSTGQFMPVGGMGGGGPCEQTNGGVEECDDEDNDCNGVIDDIEGIDYNHPQTCGICSNNCYLALLNFEPATITCVPSAMPGELPGVCEGDCAQDYFDLDADPLTCEYYCVETAPNDVVCDNKDDDCDGNIDEDVDLCTDEDNCGKCGGICFAGNASSICVHTGVNPVCDDSNTQCEIATCDPGWIDLDGVYATGCEYSCTPNGVEVCGDQVDNDCDGLVDGADNLSQDPNIGNICTGDPDGLCDTAAHEGLTACINGIVVCDGVDVLFENEVLETCNNIDDDCDGLPDDNPTDAGGACGQSNVFPCNLGTNQCINGVLSCEGENNPQMEICNGQDDNCDCVLVNGVCVTGGVDLVGNMPPMDSIGVCNPYLGGLPSPCMAGSKACIGGSVQCIGDVVAGDPGTSPTDACGIDSNCDGFLTNQPNLMNDPLNCGGCGTNCNANQAVNHAIFACGPPAGTCAFVSCQPGYWDLDGNQTCEYGPCFFASATEACNGQDENCNGQVDEGVNASPPSPVSVCGVSPAASRPECTSQVVVSCIQIPGPPASAQWQCDFPANVCNPALCSGAACCGPIAETCDGLDNDCDGLFNENVANFGQPCASDDSNPGSQGQCRDTGTQICMGGSATVCDAMAVPCAGLPGGCTEACDGIDNDCDGSTDEPYTAKGANTAFFYMPNVIKVDDTPNRWTYQFEASRPNANRVEPCSCGNGLCQQAPGQPACTETAGNCAVDCTGPNVILAGPPTPGSGNGYHTLSPPGETVDRTPSCAEPSRLPWFNVTPLEVEQTCAAAGGFICSNDTWRDACHVSTVPANQCFWGYAPDGAECRVGYVSPSKACNLGPSFDFNTVLAGDQDGLLPTRSPQLQNCFADWKNLLGNPNTAAGGNLYDLTGNLREITKITGPPVAYPVMGGAFNTAAATASPSATQDGASCDFTFYQVDDEFKFFDTGFRCCFSSDPRL